MRSIQNLPHASELVDFWRSQRARVGHLLLALDFDGTVAPIVSSPPQARLDDEIRSLLEQLLLRNDTTVAFVSGRSLSDLQARCLLPGAFYAGNHGLEIAAPGGLHIVPAATTLRPRMRAVADQLAVALNNISGVFFEDKDLSLSVHYRGVATAEDEQRVHDVVQRVVQRDVRGIRLTHGKKVIEVRPDIDWDKGRATQFLVDAVQRAAGSDIFPIFVGDDRTDEDAFRALAGFGAGIIVGTHGDTSAVACVASVREVAELLAALLLD